MTWDTASLAPLRLQGDEAADALIARMVEEGGAAGATQFFDRLIRNVDLPLEATPPAVREFVAGASATPPDIDLRRVARGQQVFIDNCPQIALILYFKSLPMTYLNWRLSRTLAMTGRLNKRDWPAQFARRVGETTQFVFDVMTPGSLTSNGVGVSTTLKVRLVHASVRHFVGRAPDFDIAKHQLPICQEDLAYTLHTFAVDMIDGLRQLDTPLDDQTAEDFFVAWKLVGHYLGIKPQAMPRDLADARAQQQVMLERLAGPSPDGADVTRALMDFAREAMLPGRWLDNSPEQLLRFFIGEPRATTLGVSAELRWLERLLPLVLRRWFGLAERLEDGGRTFKDLGDLLGVELIRGIMATFISYKGRPLQLPQQLVDRFGLTPHVLPPRG
jgi:ER-bound oxygenase mpaB/B'/Rubber oxygenase, catalytic domain